MENLKSTAAGEPNNYKNSHFTKGQADICGMKLWLLKHRAVFSISLFQNLSQSSIVAIIFRKRLRMSA